MTELSELELERQRAAKNQSLFREVNERIHDLATPATQIGFICECLNTACDEQVQLTVTEYEEIRSHSNQFLVLPGHEAKGVEEVVKSSDGYLVVSKRGAGADLAASLDPRKREARAS